MNLEAIAPWVTAAALAAPVLVAYYPPMSDLPFHEAAIGVLRNLGDEQRFPPGLYRLNLGEPNQLFHLVGWALAYVLSTRWAVKLLVAAAVAALPVCAARLAKHAGSSPLGALLVAPIALGWVFSMGLVANLVGLAVLLAAIPPLDRFAAAPTARGALAVLGAVALLYFAHMAMMLVYAVAALALATLYPWSWPRSAWRLSPVVAGVAIAVAQTRWQERYMTASVTAVSTRWEPLDRKWLALPSMFALAADPAVQVAVTGLSLVVLGSFLWLRARERRSGPGARPAAAGLGVLDRARAATLAHRWEAFGAAGLLAYFASPLSLHGAMLVYQRWFPPAFAVLAACSAPRSLAGRKASLSRLAAFAVPVACLLVAAPAFLDSDRQYRHLDELLREIQPGSAVAQVVLGPDDPSRAYLLGCATGRSLATRGGRLAYSFVDSPISPVFIPPPYQWEGASIRLNEGDLRPAHDLRTFRYLLALDNDPAAAGVAMSALAEDARLVAASGDWLLFESRHEVVPLRSAPLPLGRPPPESLADRAARLVRPRAP